MAIPNGMKTIVIPAGECAILPPDAVVLSVTVNGSATVTSSCGSLPTPSSYKCWRFLWGDMDGGVSYNDAYFTGIKIGTTTYTVAGFPTTEANTYDNGADFLTEVLPYSTPAGLVIDIVSGGGTDTDPKCLAFKIPDIFEAPILYWENPVVGGGIQYSAMIPVADECNCS